MGENPADSQSRCGEEEAGKKGVATRNIVSVDETAHRKRSPNGCMVKTEENVGCRGAGRSESIKSEDRAQSPTESALADVKQSCDDGTDMSRDAMSNSQWATCASEFDVLSSRRQPASLRIGPYLPGPYLPKAMSKSTWSQRPPPRDRRRIKLPQEPAVSPNILEHPTSSKPHAEWLQKHKARDRQDVPLRLLSNIRPCFGEARDLQQPPALCAAAMSSQSRHGNRPDSAMSNWPPPAPRSTQMARSKPRHGNHMGTTMSPLIYASHQNQISIRNAAFANFRLGILPIMYAANLSTTTGMMSPNRFLPRCRTVNLAK